MFRTPLVADVRARLKGAYAEGFAREVEERFDVHGHVTPASPSQAALAGKSKRHR